MTCESTTRTQNVPAHTDNLTDVLDSVASAMERVGFTDSQIMQLQVAAEEIFVNICHYAGLAADDPVRIEICTDPDAIHVTFSDHGRPFDLRHFPPADTTGTAEEREIGGLGIHMVRKLVDVLSYSREAGMNVVTIIKRKSEVCAQETGP